MGDDSAAAFSVDMAPVKFPTSGLIGSREIVRNRKAVRPTILMHGSAAEL